MGESGRRRESREKRERETWKERRAREGDARGRESGERRQEASADGRAGVRSRLAVRRDMQGLHANRCRGTPRCASGGDRGGRRWAEEEEETTTVSSEADSSRGAARAGSEEAEASGRSAAAQGGEEMMLFGRPHHLAEVPARRGAGERPGVAEGRCELARGSAGGARLWRGEAQSCES